MTKKYKAPHRKKLGLLLFGLTILVTALFGISTLKANLIDIKMEMFHTILRVKEFFVYYPINQEPQTTEQAKTVPVLVYHGIVNDQKDVDRFSVTQDLFREQMTALYNDGYRTISIKEFKDFMQGKISLPAKSFLLTFDDGRKDSFYGADPILERLHYTAVMFTASGQSADEDDLFSTYYLNILELENMLLTTRWEIQSHAIQSTGGFIPVDEKGTKEYFLSNKQWLGDKGRLENDEEYDARVDNEFSESKKVLESISHTPVFAVSYPFSDFGQQTKNNQKTAITTINEAVKKSYEYAFQQQWDYEDGFVGNHPEDDTYHLRRIEPASDWTGEYLVSFLHAGTDVEATKNPTSFKNDTTRWKSAWGKKELKENRLLLRTVDGKISSFTLLDGSRAWKDYTFSIETELHDAGAFALYANLERPGTGVRCVWRGGSLSVEDMVDGSIINRNLFSSKIVFGKHTFAIVSRAGVIGCIEDGNIVGGIKTSSSTGGVGVEFWNNSPLAYAEIIDANVASFLEDEVKIPSAGKKTEAKSLVLNISLDEIQSLIKDIPEELRRYISPKTGVLDSSISINILSKNEWGNNSSYYSANVSVNRYDITIADYVSGGAMWQTEDIIPEAKEYEIRGKYNSSTSTTVDLEYKTITNEIKWIRIAELKSTKETKEYSYVVELPKDTKTFKVLHQINSNGNLSILGLNAKPLQDGSFDRAYVTISFDDGYSSFIEKAVPLLAKYNMKATVPVITGSVGFKNYMTIDDLRDITTIGHEVVAHTRNHIHLDETASPAELLSEIVGSRYDLEKSGFSTSNFVYPYGSFSKEAVELVKKSGYKSARTVTRGFNTKNTDKFHLKDQIVDGKVTPAQIDEWLSTTRQNKQWLILELHRITDVPTPEDPESITVDQLDTLLKHIQDSGVEVITQQQGLEKMVK